jgi:farnesyl diphosphate synthase
VSFAATLTRDAGLVQARLDAALSGFDDQLVIHAMRYAVQGGKRLRGFMVLESARMLGIAESASVSAAAAVEALHAYSLIHDDMPCMDNDDLRRGLPTVHKKWDEATAVLAGDALQTLAFELLTDPALGAADVRVALVAGLAKASGAEGMVLGQALDIAAETAKTPLTLEQITRLQAGKTGALIRFSAEAGAILAQHDPAPRAPMPMRSVWPSRFGMMCWMSKAMSPRLASVCTRMPMRARPPSSRFWVWTAPRPALPT